MTRWIAAATLGVLGGAAWAQVGVRPGVSGVRMGRPAMLDTMRSLRPNFPQDRWGSATAVAPARSPSGVGVTRPFVRSPAFVVGGHGSRGRVVFHEGTGLTVRGAYRDGRLGVDFQLGGASQLHAVKRRGPCDVVHFPDRTYIVHPSPRFVYVGSPYYRGFDYRFACPSPALTYPVVMDPRLLVAYAEPVSAIEPAPAPEPMTAAERAARHIAQGEAQHAEAALREHLREDPADSSSMRWLGYTLLEQGRLSDGVAMMRMAYSANPSLADVPLDAGALGDDGVRRIGRVVRRLSPYANRTKSSSAWLTQAVLIQAEGRPHIARSLLVRAERAGLERRIVEPMSAALRRPI